MHVNWPLKNLLLNLAIVSFILCLHKVSSAPPTTYSFDRCPYENSTSIIFTGNVSTKQTDAALEYVKGTSLKLTFFTVYTGNTSLLKQIVDGGHTLGILLKVQQPVNYEVLLRDLYSNATYIRDVTGVVPRFFTPSPPFDNTTSLLVHENSNFTEVYSTVDMQLDSCLNNATAHTYWLNAYGNNPKPYLKGIINFNEVCDWGSWYYAAGKRMPHYPLHECIYFPSPHLGAHEFNEYSKLSSIGFNYPSAPTQTSSTWVYSTYTTGYGGDWFGGYNNGSYTSSCVDSNGRWVPKCTAITTVCGSTVTATPTVSVTNTVTVTVKEYSTSTVTRTMTVAA